MLAAGFAPGGFFSSEAGCVGYPAGHALRVTGHTKKKAPGNTRSLILYAVTGASPDTPDPPDTRL